VALSVGTPRGVAARVYPAGPEDSGAGYAASCPVVFGLSSPGLATGSDTPLFPGW